MRAAWLCNMEKYDRYFLNDKCYSFNLRPCKSFNSKIDHLGRTSYFDKSVLAINYRSKTPTANMERSGCNGNFLSPPQTGVKPTIIENLIEPNRPNSPALSRRRCYSATQFPTLLPSIPKISTNEQQKNIENLSASNENQIKKKKNGPKITLISAAVNKINNM